MQASNFNDFENHCELYYTPVAEEYYEAKADIVTIWTELLVKSFSDRGPYGKKNWGKKMKKLVGDAIHLALLTVYIYM